MPVPEQTPVATFTGNGVTTVFPIAWGAGDASHILVEVDGVELALGVDYTATVDGTSGTVTMVTAPAVGAAIAITRDTPLERLVDYQESGPFLAETIDEDNDSPWRAMQDLKYRYQLAPTLPRGHPLAGHVSLPPPGAGKYLRWNAAGTNLEAVNAVADNGSFTASGAGAVTRTVDSKLGENVSVKDFGAKGDGVTADTMAINRAIAALYASGGGRLNFPPGEYLCDGTIVPRRGVICTAAPQSVVLRLADSADVALVKSYKFDELYAASAYTLDDDPDMTLDYGFEGFTFVGNGAVATNPGGYLVQMYGRRLRLVDCVIANSKGVGLWTALRGGHSTYDYTATKQPGLIDNVEIVDSHEEAWIFEGPSDQPIGTVVTNVSGDQGNDGTTPQTSTHFSGEEVSSLVVAESMQANYLNLNGARFGRCFRTRTGGHRLAIDTLIAAGGWGNVFVASDSYGRIGNLSTRANPTAWGGVAKPNVETQSDDVQFSSVTVARVQGQDQSAAPCILDSGGAQWGMVRARQALNEGGTFFKADANGIRIQSLGVTGAAIALHTTSNCERIDVSCTFINCDLVWKNEGASVRGVWAFSGSLESGQVFATGLTSAPNAHKPSLSNARIEYYDSASASWKSNSFRGEASFDATTTNGQTVSFSHGMWRAPRADEISFSARVSSWSSEPAGVSLTINSFNDTQVAARIKLDTAATGSPVGQILCRIN